MSTSSASSQAKKTVQRPLSPHLQIYKPQITSVMSIFHRITGVGLSFALVFFVWFTLSLISGEEAYQNFRGFLGSLIGVPMILAIIIGLYYHLFNGIRHLLWDAGHGYKIDCVTRSGKIVFALTAGFSFLTFIALIF